MICIIESSQIDSGSSLRPEVKNQLASKKSNGEWEPNGKPH